MRKQSLVEKRFARYELCGNQAKKLREIEREIEIETEIRISTICDGFQYLIECRLLLNVTQNK